MRKPNWYDNVEPPIRKLVKLLRDNGFNTTCSCGHGMWVELDIYRHMDDLELLRNLLLEHGHQDFTITGDLTVMDLWPVRRAKVYLGGYLPPDDTSVREYTSKIACFKEESERFHQQNYRLRERNKHLREEVCRLRRKFHEDRKRPGG